MKNTIIAFLSIIALIGQSYSLSYAQTQIGPDFIGTTAGEFLGDRVAIAPNKERVAITSYRSNSSVRVYDLIAGNWVQMGDRIFCGCNSLSFSADGNRLAIGSTNLNSAGRVQIFDWINDVWVQVGANINGEAAADNSGTAISLSADGNRLAIGAPRNDENGENSGHVRVYALVMDTWTQLGMDIDGEEIWGLSGHSVSFSSDGNRLAIGEPRNDGNGFSAGVARVFELSGGNWQQIGQNIDGEAEGDWSGRTLSLSSDGNRLAIAAHGNDGNAESAGHVRVYGLTGSSWQQVGGDIDGEAAMDMSGYSVSLSGDGKRVAIGANFNDGNGNLAGHVRIFDLIGSTWTQKGQDIDGKAAFEEFGSNLMLSSDGNTIIIGGHPINDPSGDKAGKARVYSLESPSAALNYYEDNIRVIPNPTKGKIELIGIEAAEIKILDNLGRILFEKKNSQPTIDISHLANGLYFIQINLENHSETKKVLKN